MRFALMIYGSLDLLSGGYLYDRQLVRHLRAAGHSVEIIALPARHYARHLVDHLDADLRRRLEAGRWDVLLQDELCHPSLFLVNRRLRGRAPIVGVVHHLRVSEQHPPALRPMYRAVERAYLRTLDGFLFNSRATHATAHALAGPLPPSAVAVPAGDRFHPLPSPAEIEARARTPGPLRVVAPGNVIRRKGLHTLVAGLGLLPRPSWRLTIAGNPDVDPAYTAELRGLCRRLRVADRVRFTGVLSEDGMRSVLTSSDVLALPSWYEGYGIVYVEGMGFGLPALAGSAGAAGEIITPGVDGWLVAPGAPEAVAAALRPLLWDRGRLAALGLAARRRFEAHPTWEQSMERARRFLESLVT